MVDAAGPPGDLTPTQVNHPAWERTSGELAAPAIGRYDLRMKRLSCPSAVGLVLLCSLAVVRIAHADAAPPEECDDKSAGDECFAPGIENGHCVPCTDGGGNTIPDCLTCEETTGTDGSGTDGSSTGDSGTGGSSTGGASTDGQPTDGAPTDGSSDPDDSKSGCRLASGGDHTAVWQLLVAAVLLRRRRT